MTMTPREAAISVLETAANTQGELLTKRQGHESVMSHLQREERLHKAAIEWAQSMPASVTPEAATGLTESGKTMLAYLDALTGITQDKQGNFIVLEHDGDCNLLNGADGAGCNCTARERQRMQDRIGELEEQLRWNALLLETAAQESAARTQRLNEMEEGVKLLIQTNHNYLDKMKELTQQIDRYRAPLVLCTPTDITKEELAGMRKALHDAPPCRIDIVREGTTIPTDVLGNPMITTEMKAECIGEFTIEEERTCHNCDISEPGHATEHDPDCEVCHGTGTYTQKITVPWTTCKDIYKRMVAAAAGSRP